MRPVFCMASFPLSRMMMNTTSETIGSMDNMSNISSIATVTAALFDPSNVNLESADPKEVICYLTFHGEDVNETLMTEQHQHAARVSSVVVLFIVSTFAIMFPVLAQRVTWLRLPLYLYLMMRYFGAGVIIATAFIHLLDPAYSEIGPQTCVGMTGGWASYSWPPAIAMTSAMLVFLLDFWVECHVQSKHGLDNINVHGDVEGTVTRQNHTTTTTATGVTTPTATNHSSTTVASIQTTLTTAATTKQKEDEALEDRYNHPEAATTTTTSTPPEGTHHVTTAITLPLVDDSSTSVSLLENNNNKKPDATITATTSEILSHDEHHHHQEFRTFPQQLAAFLVLEFGVIFHSIIIGLNLGVAETEFRTLYPVLTFHQCFEGLGIGTRLSVIPFPRRYRMVPWLLCLAFGMTTPIAVAIGLSLRASYSPDSFTANVVSGVFDSISAGILLYTGFVELLARDFLFHPERSLDKYRVSFMVCCLYLGIAIMGLLGKWA